jgi:hypothetical protein
MATRDICLVAERGFFSLCWFAPVNRQAVHPHSPPAIEPRRSKHCHRIMRSSASTITEDIERCVDSFVSVRVSKGGDIKMMDCST